MKKLFLSALAVVCAMSLTSCDDFLDSENYTEANTDNFPATANDMNTLLSAAYCVMNQYCADPLQTPWFVWHIMSDDANGAGGTGDVECTAIGHLMVNKEDLFSTAWHCTYVGIARTNSIIASIDNFDWSGNESTRNQMLGEAYFLRGLFYLWGVQFWGDIPAYWAAAAPDPCDQLSAKDEIFPHILADFVSAMNLMEHNVDRRAEGHATKVSAEGYLARAYMFYEGFYMNETDLGNASPAAVSLPDQEGVSGSLSKQDVIDALKDAIDNSGASLIDDFRCLWQYTNKYTKADYAYVQDADEWAGNGNVEQVFDVKFANIASWNATYTMGFTNMTSLYCSLRCDADGLSRVNGGKETFPFGQGWGQGVFNSNLFDDWSSSDPRKQATILNGREDGELADIASSNPYANGASQTEPYTSICFTSSCSEETGYYNKKWMAFTCYDKDNYDTPDSDGETASFSTSSDPYTWWGYYRSQGGFTNMNGNSFQGDHFCDIVLMRFADILLMHSELSKDASGLNQVQARAHVDQTGYSLDAIKKERRFEFAGEGIRFNDLRRWSGINGGESCEAASALNAQIGSEIYYTNDELVDGGLKHASSSFAKRYAETNGFLKKPESQSEYFGTQNAGWGTEGSMTGKPIY